MKIMNLKEVNWKIKLIIPMNIFTKVYIRKSVGKIVKYFTIILFLKKMEFSHNIEKGSWV